MKRTGLIEKYHRFLPVSQQTPHLSLLEGSTPLIPLHTLSKEWGVRLFAKYEGANPTGSFKDRGMVLAVAKAKEEGSKAVICASTGNTSASAAAYAARAGLRCAVVIPDGKIAAGKLAQAKMYGADIFSIKGNFDEALQMVRRLSEEEAFTLVNSVNPYRLEGQKTGAFELVDELGGAPDMLAIPVGNAGNISAYWKGFKQYGKGLPALAGFQAEGAAPFVLNRIIEQPETVATAIRIGNPASWNLAVEAINQSGGSIDSVSDDEILDAYLMLARKEGVFAEPASCAPLAGLKKMFNEGRLAKGITIVTVLTGNGLKDPAAAMSVLPSAPAVLPADWELLRQNLSGAYV
ncbi:threonine synthase [Fictibacillus iocasae]|uniref:Threonine synthase n=1 Tax=Fictibacillus iocasae TaxID=2715437 RepID=A0ABW2NQG7_9BACL